MPLEPGPAATVERVVTRELTANAFGNPGVTVFATPFVAILRGTHRRRFLFEVEAWDEVEKIAEGRHERSMVADLAHFLVRAAAKGRASLRSADERP